MKVAPRFIVPNSERGRDCLWIVCALLASIAAVLAGVMAAVLRAGGL